MMGMLVEDEEANTSQDPKNKNKLKLLDGTPAFIGDVLSNQDYHD